MSRLHVQVQASFSCPWYRSMCSLHVHFQVPSPSPYPGCMSMSYCISMSNLHVHVHAGCSCRHAAWTQTHNHDCGLAVSGTAVRATLVYYCVHSSLYTGTQIDDSQQAEILYTKTTTNRWKLLFFIEKSPETAFLIKTFNKIKF